MRTDGATLRLLTWFSPAFPVGAFGYSHGLETAIREGAVGDRETLLAWILGLLEHGSGWTDAVLFRAAWAAADRAELSELAELADALAPSLERRRESLGQGAAFLKAVGPWRGRSPSTPSGSPSPKGGGDSRLQPPSPPPLGEGDREGVEGAYPIAAGSTCAAAGLPLEPSLIAWLHGFAANLVSVALRAIPLGQSDGVAALAALEPALLAVADRAANSTLDDLGVCAFRSDIAAMRHETLQPRLFIS